MKRSKEFYSETPHGSPYYGMSTRSANPKDGGTMAHTYGDNERVSDGYLSSASLASGNGKPVRAINRLAQKDRSL